jgi:glycosyltransferase involved in cell wall biosynthesis
LLKDAILAAELHNSKLTVIDLFKTSGSEQCETWGSTPVKFIPKVSAEKMPEFFSQIDVLVAPSLWPESFGLITREAALAGVWVVASNKGGLAEDIRSGVDGDVFSPDNIDELVSILKKIERQPEKYQQQCVPAAARIRSIDEQVSELESFYENILNEQKVLDLSPQI